MRRHEELVGMLTTKLRVMLAQQVARAWFEHTVAPQKIALQFLRRHARQGVFALEPAMVHPPLALSGPLFVWRPGETEEPDWGALAWRVRSRWNQDPVRAVLVTAGPKARARTGGNLGARAAVRVSERSHDVSLAEVFLQLDAERARHWIPEDALEDSPGRLGKRPDAVLRQGEEETVLELLGKAYTRDRILGLHRAWRDGNYEFW